MRLKTVQRTWTAMATAPAVAAVLAVAALAGPLTAAHALQFGTGDAVLVLYGNNTEYVQNLGNFSTLLSTGTDINLSTILGNSNVASPNTIQYTIVGNTSTQFFFGDGTQRSTWSSTNLNQVVPTNYNTALAGWSGQLANAGDARSLIPASDGLSFSSNLDPAGKGTLGGSIPGTRPAFATIDSTLYLLQRDNTGAASTLAQVGTAFLSSQTGHFVISAVPVPAAAVLFATGMIGLVGVARRRALGLQ